MAKRQLEPEDYPDWIHPDLEDISEELLLVQELWDGLRHGNIKKYIPKETDEPDTDYKKRVEQTEFDDLFKPTIKGYSGLLSNFKLSDDVAQSIVENQKNIDGQGNNLEVFLADGDDAVLRDGCCAYLVDYPDTRGLDISTPIKLIEAQLRPYISLIERINILNAETIVVNGQHILTMIVIRTTQLVKKGRFGVESQTIYKVFERGSIETNNKCSVTSYSIEMVDGEKVLTQVGDPAYFNCEEIPIILYSTNDRDPLKALPPFLNSARLNRKLIRKQSQLDEVMRRINLPVAVISDDNTGEININTGKIEFKKISIGCNTVVHTSSNGKFYFAEPSGAAIASTQEDIAQLLKAIDRVSLAFLSGGKEGSMTATEALLNTAQVTTTIDAIARRKESVVQSLFTLWCQFTGEPVGGTIAIDDSVIRPAMTDQGAQVVLNAITDGALSRELGFTILKENRWLSEGTDIEAEIARQSAIGV